MADTRRAGASATATLTVAGATLTLDAAAGRGELDSAFRAGLVSRTLPGGVIASIPTGQRVGTVRTALLRTRTTDRALCAAGQRIGTLVLRPSGDGSGLPQRSVSVVVSTSLTVLASQLSGWVIDMAATGPVTDSTQT